MTRDEVVQSVRERDGFRCVDCGRTDADYPEYKKDALQVHRLTPGSRYTVDGCVLVCIPCHSKRHVVLRDRQPTVGVRIPAAIAKRLQLMSVVEEVTITRLLHDYLSPLIDKDFPKALKTVQDWGMKVEEDD